MGSESYRKTRCMILSRGLLAPFITLMLVCGILVYYFATYSRDKVEDELMRTSSVHRGLIDEFLKERTADLQFAASSYSIDEISHQARLSKLFRDLQVGSRAFFDLGVFDGQGNHLAYVGPYNLVGINYSEAQWFKEVREKGLFISDVFLGYRNIPHFVIAVRRDEGTRSWYLRATMDTLSFNDLVESIRMGKTGEAYIVNRKGILQTKRRSGGDLMEQDPDYECYKIDHENITSFSAQDHLNRRYLYASGPMARTDWVLLVRQKAVDAYASLARAVMIAVIVILVGGAVVIAMAYILASSLASRLSMAVLEKQQMKTQLIMAGKLAEIGEMSTGLAHEINNPLQIMKSEHAMIEELLSGIGKSTQAPDQESMRLIKDSVKQIDLQIQRCKRITHGLLNFARKNDVSVQPIRIQEFIPEIIGMVEQRAQLENIHITLNIDPELPPIMSDSNQLQQVFLNLLNNAIHAIKNNGGGEIRISASHEDTCVNISVADNGCGIPPENMERIFLPFFTTKPVGQGTGLGLSTVLGIVKGNGGEIVVTSECDGGTVFNVLLPLKPAGDQENQTEALIKEG